jgi:hypothetical protein
LFEHAIGDEALIDTTQGIHKALRNLPGLHQDFGGTSLASARSGVLHECTEFCRCTAVWCLNKEHLVKTQEQWSQWQANYFKEMADPTPFKSLMDGHLTGTLDQFSSDWLSGHVGMPQDVLWHTDGSVSSGDASVSFTPCSLLPLGLYEIHRKFFLRNPNCLPSCTGSCKGSKTRPLDCSQTLFHLGSSDMPRERVPTRNFKDIHPFYE